VQGCVLFTSAVRMSPKSTFLKSQSDFVTTFPFIHSVLGSYLLYGEIHDRWILLDEKRVFRKSLKYRYITLLLCCHDMIKCGVLTLMYKIKNGGNSLISKRFIKFSLYVLYSFSATALNLFKRVYKLTYIDEQTKRTHIS
jgi:hypothetical protein